jgi:polysaccharide export outer membrane protein
MRITTNLKLGRAAAWLLLLGPPALGAAAQGPATSVLPALSSSDGTPLLGRGDIIQVVVFDTPELSGSLRLDQNGFVNLPLGGLVDLKGLDTQQAAAAIRDRLRSAGIMLDPYVTVSVTDYAGQGLVILGEVKTPGNYPLLGPRSLYDVLAMAGGPATAVGASITITRRNDPEHPVKVPVSLAYSDILRTTMVGPGDIIIVDQAPLYYVLGDVGHTGAFTIQAGEKLDILNAVALAGGLLQTAEDKKATIIRKSPNGPVVIPVNIKDILHNKQPNILLEASDVLVIPRSGLKTFVQTALPALTNSGISAGVSAAIVR